MSKNFKPVDTLKGSQSLKNEKYRVRSCTYLGHKGITLIALIITIIILLILAVTSVVLVMRWNILDKTEYAAEGYQVASEKEAIDLAYDEYVMDNLNNENAEFSMGDEADVDKNENGWNIKFKNSGNQYHLNLDGSIDSRLKYKISDVLGQGSHNSNIDVEDEYGNVATIPAGFTIVPDGTDSVEYNYTENKIPSVQDGIVIKDDEGNEFVWIPVGDIKNKDGGTTTITLGRYTFDSIGNPSTPIEDGSAIGSCTEDTSENHKSNFNNVIAKDIESFKTNTQSKGGYYIARYEASYNKKSNKPYSKQSVGTPQSASGEQYTPTEDGQLWNNLTQPKAAEAAQRMYGANNNFECDLINSYAWDTAIVFIEKYSTSNYANQQTKNTSGPANTGERVENPNTTDKVCNIYDMASNCFEWTTETGNPATDRGGSFRTGNFPCASRYPNSTSYAMNYHSFRVVLYVTY